MDDYTWHARDLCEDALKWNLDDYEALLALGRLKEQLGHEEESRQLNSVGLKYVAVQFPLSPFLPPLHNLSFSVSEVRDQEEGHKGGQMTGK